MLTLFTLTWLSVIICGASSLTLHKAETGDRCIGNFFNEVDFLVPFYSAHAPFVAYLLNSIDLFVPCRGDIVFVMTPEDVPSFLAVKKVDTKFHILRPSLPDGFGYLEQQLITLRADIYTTRKYVMMLDTDVVLSSYRLDECYIHDNKIIVHCIPYDSAVAARQPENLIDIWRRGTEHALGVNVSAECMTRIPLLYPREIFAALRKHIEALHSKNFTLFLEDYFHGHSTKWAKENLLLSNFQILNHFAYNFMSRRFEFRFNQSDVKFCGRHLGHEIERNNALSNPKLVQQYFSLAAQVIFDCYCENEKNRRHKLCHINPGPK